MITEALLSIQPYDSLLGGPGQKASGQLGIRATSVATYPRRKYAWSLLAANDPVTTRSLCVVPLEQVPLIL
jgi:hypothetical protein